MQSDYFHLLNTNDSATFNAQHIANSDSEVIFPLKALDNCFLTDFHMVNIDFSSATFDGCYFKNVLFWASDFSNVHFKNCFFVSCHFGTPELMDANAVSLMRFVFQPTLFSNTHFFKCNFLGANFREVDLKNTQLEECVIENCDFRSTNLTQIADKENNWLRNHS